MLGGGGWACAVRGLAIRIVLAIDFWEPAATTYRLNHPETEVLCADVRDESVRQKILDLAKDRGVSLILGGIPCEWLSVYRHLQKVKITERDANRRTLDSCLDLVKCLDPEFCAWRTSFKSSGSCRR